MKKTFTPFLAILFTLTCIGSYFAVSFLIPTHEIWIYQIFFFFIPAFWGLSFPPHQSEHHYLKKPMFKDLLFILCLSLLISGILHFLSFYWTKIFPLPESYQNYYRELLKTENIWDFLALIIKVGLLPAICEEFLLRGFLQNTLQKSWSFVPALLVTTLIFSISHINPRYLPFYVILGLYLGWCQNYRSNLVYPIMGHTINNIIALLVFRFT